MPNFFTSLLEVLRGIEGNDYSTESNSTSTNEEPREEEITLHWYETDMMDDL